MLSVKFSERTARASAKMPDQYNFLRKYALLDTNILKEMSQNTKRSESFRPVFEFLKEKEIEPFILDATRFEFVGYSSNKKDFDILSSYIGTFWTLSTTRDDIDLATKLSAMFKCKNASISPKQISLVDCLHATQILKYKSRAFVVTTDINDYPSFLFDTQKYFPIEENGGNTTFVAFKTFNEKKWAALEKNFDTSG